MQLYNERETMENMEIKVGTVFNTLPPKSVFGNGNQPRTHFYLKKWDKELMKNEGKWVILDTDALKKTSSFWTMAKDYNKRYSHLGYKFEARNIDGVKCLFGSYNAEPNMQNNNPFQVIELLTCVDSL